ncbi:coiled-coil domain-containing protein 30 isoform X2 [Mugil cephalus]|uniref:coiled-coil domain-containing protein 30 isoform X2 n=1 Tax=Mugil cephalus TaxID=48193 RepID=UPI001FB7E039|nr:coiled-coil domain-containing protein 30 isoform X2 [Mugil cephalus]
MEQAEELEQIASWFSEEGLPPDSPKEDQLCFLWRALQHTRSHLSKVTRELETHRSQHVAEMAEVRKSLEQIRIFTEHKDVLAQEIQDENDQLQEQMRRLVSLQDAQISEVAKMLYQQGLTELIHSSPSEQVAYLLVERASLLETSEDPHKRAGDGNTTSLSETGAQVLNTTVRQTEARHLADQASSLGRECSRLERDVEEGSRRLAMAHKEIRRLTDELESAHLTRRAYEPEMQSAQEEVEQLRQEVENLKKYEMVELRKTKELNDRLDFEIRALRSRVRSLDAEKSSLLKKVVSLQEEVEQMESALQEQQQQFLSVQVQAQQATEVAEVESLQKKAEWLESALQEQQQQLFSVQVQAKQADELAKAQTAELAKNRQTCSNFQEKLAAQTRLLSEKEEIVESMQKEVERLESVLQLLTAPLQAGQDDKIPEPKATELVESNQTCRDLGKELSSHMSCLSEKKLKIHSLNNSHNVSFMAKVCTKENNIQDQKILQLCGSPGSCTLEDLFMTEDKELQTELYKTSTLHKEATKSVRSTEDECETLKKEICDTLKCLDKERSKNHEMKEKHKSKVCRAKQKFDEETSWRDEKIKCLERELSLCSHSLTKEKQLVTSISLENEKLLFERRQLLQQLDEEEHNKKGHNLTVSLSKSRVDFLEMENKKLGNKIFHMANQLATLERSLQNLQSLHFVEELKRMSTHRKVFTSVPLQTSSVMSPELAEIQSILDSTQSGDRKQTDVTHLSHCCISGSLRRSSEMGYMNLTSTQSLPDHSASLSTSDFSAVP